MTPSPGRPSGSPHFGLAELRCAHCHVAVIRPQLLALLERIRAAVGRPIALRSAYRCPVHNAEVGGAVDSQHMYGAAADLPGGVVSLEVARRAGAVGVGTKDGWAVHVDVRDGPVTTWRY